MLTDSSDGRRVHTSAIIDGAKAHSDIRVHQEHYISTNFNGPWCGQNFKLVIGTETDYLKTNIKKKKNPHTVDQGHF